LVLSTNPKDIPKELLSTVNTSTLATLLVAKEILTAETLKPLPSPVTLLVAPLVLFMAQASCNFFKVDLGLSTVVFPV
jgi:hypothetical protein